MKEITTGTMSSDFDFCYDGAGEYGEAGCAYLRFTIKTGVYQNQTHVLRIKFSYGSNQVYTFPQDPPNVTFETPVFHPNIATGGSICLDVIKNKWSPMYGIETIFNSIMVLLECPNVDSPYNSEAARKYSQHLKKDTIERYRNICTEYYRKKMSKNEHAEKLISIKEFDLPLLDRLQLFGVPKSKWPKELL
jgi:ubiquitin-protein ligase